MCSSLKTKNINNFFNVGRDDIEVLSTNSDISDVSSFADITPATPPSSPFGSIVALDHVATAAHCLSAVGPVPQSELTSDILTMALNEFSDKPDCTTVGQANSFQGKIGKTRTDRENEMDLFDFVIVAGKL